MFKLQLKRIFLSHEFLIFTFAFVLRFIYLLQMEHLDPQFYNPTMDPLYHHNWATSIAKGDWIGQESFFRAPLYPYFLGIVYTLFGINLFIPRLIQSVIGALSCLLIFKIGTSLFKKKVGIIAGVIAACYPLFIYFENELLIPSLLIFLVLLGFYLLVRQAKTGGTRLSWLLTGVVWGLAAITRPNILVFLFFLPIWFYQTLKKKFIIPLLFGAMGALLMIAPVTIRNYAVSKEFVLIAWQGGTNFYIGNNPQSDGKTAIIPGTKKSWYGGYYDAQRIANETTGRELKNSEVDRFWLNKGIQFIKENPGKEILLLLKKIYLFWGGYEIPNNRDLYYFTRPTFLRYIFFKIPFFQFPFGLMMPLAIAGAWFAFKKKAKTSVVCYFVIPYSVSFILFFVCARYRLTVIPFVIIFASYAIHEFVYGWRRHARVGVVPVVLFLSSLIFLNANLTNIRNNPALNDFTMGSVEFGKRNYALALSYFEKALPYYNKDAEFLVVMADCFFQMKNYKEAYKYYYQVTLIDPKNAEAYDRIGSVFYMIGQMDKAKECYHHAMEINPRFSSVYFNIAHIYYQSDSLEKALWNYKNAIALRTPNLADAYYYVGVVEYRLGHRDSALFYLQRTLVINPQHAGAKEGLMSLQKN